MCVELTSKNMRLMMSIARRVLLEPEHIGRTVNTYS